MCQEMGNLYNEGVEQDIALDEKCGMAIGVAQGEKRGIEIGREASKREAALSLHAMGLQNVMIAQAVKEKVSLVE